MRRGWVVGISMSLVAIAVVATVATAADAPSKEIKQLNDAEIAALTSEVQVVTTKNPNKDVHTIKSVESSKIDTAGALVTLQKELTADALDKATKITFTKVRFTDDLLSSSVVAPNALVWIATVDGFRSYSHGGPTEANRPVQAKDQMNLVIDAETGEFLVAYPGVVGHYPGTTS